MKKLLLILTFVMCFAFGLAFTACDSGSNNPSEGLAYTLINGGTAYEVSDIGDCTDEDVIIPSTYKGLPVTSIGKAAFFNCDDLTSVKIPESVTSIDKSAFYECSNLTSIHFPESVKSIDDEAFYACRSLTGIKILDSITSIGNRAFCHCTSLTKIKIPKNVISIGEYAFYNCSRLTVYCEAESPSSGWNFSWNYSNCPVYWYRENQPTTTGNYWHYGTDGKALVVWDYITPEE